ncbi:TolC family protein [Azospirillum sp. sgz302134]
MTHLARRRWTHRTFRIALVGLALSALPLILPPAEAAPPDSSPRAALERLMGTSRRVAAAKSDLEGSDANLARARAGWYPELRLTTEAGREIQRTPTGDSRLPAFQAGVSVRQPLLDFGRIGGEIEKAGLARRQSETTVRDSMQDVMLEGLVAHINLVRTKQMTDYARQSVRNIEKQTGLEESRVDLGGGYASDVLQAKSQLAGARARLARAQGAQVNALNRYRAVFEEEPPAATAKLVVLPPSALPPTLEDAVRHALESSPQTEIGRLSVDIARAEVGRVRGAELAPRIDAVIDIGNQHNVQGLNGTKREDSYKVQMTMPFNLGMAPLHSIDAAQAAARASASRYADRRLAIEEQVRNAWQNYETARETYSYFDNQARIAAEFLRLAREERQQGRRSLIDVLSGETSLYNAQSDAASAQADVSIAAFTLLRVIGGLDLDVVP